ncbi:hypothetical protein [Novipirellula rosea]|uniref:hypothetical protein n=1 Tax=Novipirellula rosea TaxID=1031540 RepID=UPI0031EAD0C9
MPESQYLLDNVSFWGGIASILAVFATAVSFGLRLIRSASEKRAELNSELLQTTESIAERVRKATTQGKRQDLFIYYQSMLSQRRFSQTVMEINSAVYHIGCLILLIPLILYDARAEYYVDAIFGPTAYVRSWLPVWILVFAFAILLINYRLRTRVRARRKILQAMERGLVGELRSQLSELVG